MGVAEVSEGVVGALPEVVWESEVGWLPDLARVLEERERPEREEEPEREERERPEREEREEREVRLRSPRPV